MVAALRGQNVAGKRCEFLMYECGEREEGDLRGAVSILDLAICNI